MTPDLDQPWLPRLAELAQQLEPGCEVYDLYPIGDDRQNHNFNEPCACRCFPEVVLYNSVDGRPDIVTVTHRWTQ